MSFESFLINVLAYIIPIYAANASALVFGGGAPLDLNKKFFGKPLLGKGKTIRGTIAALFFGFLAAFVCGFFVPAWFTANYFVFGIFLVVGAVMGDIMGSFIKRRFGLAQGQPVLFLDQLDFVIGSILSTLWMRIPSFEEVVAIMIVTLFVHKASNCIAYKLRMKRVPW